MSGPATTTPGRRGGAVGFICLASVAAQATTAPVSVNPAYRAVLSCAPADRRVGDGNDPRFAELAS